MARVTAILFIFGSLWAPFAWVQVAALFADDPGHGRHFLSFNVLVGYGVWFGWGWHCLTGRFPLFSTRQFWTISLATHLIWLVVILDDAALWGLELSLFELWITSNVIVAIGALLSEAMFTRVRDRIERAVCYGLITFMAFHAAWKFDILPGMSVVQLLMAAIALFMTARSEPRQSGPERP